MRARRRTAVSRWFCRNNTRKMFVKIVHPGGHVELQDGPIVAAEILRRNPKSCVTYPNFFQQPWAIVAPEATLLPGQKFYVVPIRTVRKLQLLSVKYSASQLQEKEIPATKNRGFLFRRGDHANEVPYSCLKQSDYSGKGTRSYNIFTFLISGIKAKVSRKGKRKENGSSEMNALVIRWTKDHFRSSKKKSTYFDHWQPNLESINEES